MSIKTIPELIVEKDTAITLGGVPSPVDSTDHNTLLENVLDSIAPREQIVAVDDKANSDIDFGQAGSRGAILLSLTGAFDLASFSNFTKGDKIFIVISGNFAFTINAAFTTTNSITIGQYAQSATGVNVLEVMCVNDNASTEFFVFNFLTTKQIDDFQAAAPRMTFTSSTISNITNLTDSVYTTISDVTLTGGGVQKHITRMMSFDVDNDSNPATFDVRVRARVVGGAGPIYMVLFQSQGTVAASNLERVLVAPPSFVLPALSDDIQVLYEINPNAAGGTFDVTGINVEQCELEFYTP